ncbi:DUF6804 family protein [Pseudarthrobacter sp. BIM B-2242]|uniref:DUF6804 family protein n=1 Tax=Pseudarthrobacter sp. BIM B-2242 TaxID=2772401 RepID=UPI00168B977F|nr:DUF6804 family protein [Pseudarthrobacter sp. BIM B-2242]QOD06091.1 hypothetical protein IDT60_21250 [Pseudarthrobacter sp. BIM B-2242]
METEEVMDAAREAALRNITGPVQVHRVRISIHGKSWDVLILSVNQFVGWIRVHGDKAVWRYGSLISGAAETDRLAAGRVQSGFTMLGDLIGDWYARVGPLNGAVQFPSIDTVGEFVGCIENQTAPAPTPRPAATAPAALVSAPSQPAPAAVEFNSQFHTTERHPPASGFTESDLNGVPLVTVHPATVPAVVAGFLLLVAILGAPYSFYEVVRWGVTAMAIWSAIVAGGQKRTAWAVAFSATAVLFNPLIPVYLTRETWLPLDAAAMVLFISAGVKLQASRPATAKDGPQRITG